MKAAIDRAADLGVKSVTIGMPHRGRLNVLGNVVRKPLRQIFSEFSGGGHRGCLQGRPRPVAECMGAGPLLPATAELSRARGQRTWLAGELQEL